jgi:uncharacterized phage-associated protein
VSTEKIKFNKEKFKEAILFLISQYPDKSIEGKKKLAKLLYFSDFNSFEAYEKPVTGASYRALPMGPVPDELDEMIKEMKGKVVVVAKKDIGLPNDMMVFSIKDKKDELSFSLLSDEEKKVLRNVYNNYGNISGGILENISHSEAPYNAVAQGEYIPYELAFYRDKSQEELVGK